MRPSPALLAFVEMLALPALALDELVERELADNPALERDGSGAPRWERWGSRDVVAPSSAREQLSADVAAALPARDRHLVEYVVGSLDERGFLDADLDELAAVTGTEVARLERVLQAVRDTGPAGVGTCDVRESLLLQLDSMAGGRASGLARRIVECHLDDLAHGRDAAIAVAVGVTREEIAAARELIRTRLRPYADLGPVPTAPPVVPDVVIVERADKPGAYDVQLPEAERYGLALNPLYERLARDDGQRLSASERARVVAQVAQARAFMERVGRRHDTLHRVARLVVSRQAAFLRNGGAALMRLTRTEVAGQLGLHESTVSRAVAGRYARLPGGRIIPFSDMFRHSLGAEEALAQLVSAEQRPRSDAQLADELAARGFRVARRTVAKYRDRLGILPYALR